MIDPTINLISEIYHKSESENIMPPYFRIN